MRKWIILVAVFISLKLLSSWDERDWFWCLVLSMLREACHLDSKEVDEAMKLENKGLIAQLVCVSLPLKGQWEFGCRCWWERVGAPCPAQRELAMGSELSRTGPFWRWVASHWVLLPPNFSGLSEMGRLQVGQSNVGHYLWSKVKCQSHGGTYFSYHGEENGFWPLYNLH